MRRTICVLVLVFASATALSSGQAPNTGPHTSWICLEPTIPTHTVPEHELSFAVVAGVSGCRIAVPILSGEKLQIDSKAIDAANGLEGFFVTVRSLEDAERYRANTGEPFTEFPHTAFFTTLMAEYNYSNDGVRARFCALFPRAYVPLLGWHGLTEPKPCSDKAPRL